MSASAENLFGDCQVNMTLLKERSVERWGAMGNDCIPLTAADPDYPPAVEIRDALRDLAESRYLPYGGVPGLEESISRGLGERRREEIPPEFIIPVGGAAAGLYATAAAVLEPGDEAIVFTPVDFMFASAVRYAGGKVVYFPAAHEDGSWHLEDLEAYITPRTRMICLCNPHNPLGLLYSEEELLQIALTADRHGLWIMNDEVWADIVYSEKPFVSIHSLPAALTRRVITSYGLAKGFSAAGLHAGCVYAADREAFERIRAVTSGHQYTISLPSLAGMKAAFDRAFYWVDAFTEHLQGNRDFLFDRLNTMPMVKAGRQEATFVSFIDIRASGLDSAGFCDFMQREQKVALIPGTAEFFGPGGEGFVRLSYATSRGILSEALDRMEEGLRKLEHC